jgi:hypothetical protein
MGLATANEMDGDAMADTWEFKDLALAKSVAILAATAYWRSKATATGLPSRSQLDPLEMRQFLAKILIVDIETGGDFIFRLCGTEISAANGRDLTGQRASQENLGASLPQFIDAYQRAIRDRQPIFFIGHMWWQDRAYVAFEQAVLPLSSDGSTIDKLLCVVDFEVPPPE